MADRETGTVKWFNKAKGYGFIERTQGGDIFVHQNSLRDGDAYSLNDGDKLEFIVTQGKKGPQADDVIILD